MSDQFLPPGSGADGPDGTSNWGKPHRSGGRDGPPPHPPHVAADARRAVLRVLDGAPGLPGDGDRIRADASLVVSELVSNAVQHGGGVTGFRADLIDDGAGLRLEVDDASTARPVARRTLGPDPAVVGGFGWPIVQSLASSVTVEVLPAGGKRIVVVLPLG
ncbi:ATP-binding protein [Actinacidiphila acididurans]|uniref:ATP-binding protein n=1 Tax=Actinacidiphila acididurans TaxID=2784346 RepID=A0ABS2U038_9ACTN|nr:ATP-binding protein [Actinacidiphila acididurans]MBM9508692.1 ATP-binding protein [Actinacidiphila acididurans]